MRARRAHWRTLNPAMLRGAKFALLFPFHVRRRTFTPNVSLFLFSECSFNRTLDAPLSPMGHTFSSPYYPSGYPGNTTCGWYITAPKNHTVALHLTYRLNNNAKNDKVEVYDVDGSERSLVNFFRRSYSTKTVTIYSKFNSLYVLFKSEDQRLWRAKGLFVSYTAVTQGKLISLWTTPWRSDFAWTLIANYFVAREVITIEERRSRVLCLQQ